MKAVLFLNSCYNLSIIVGSCDFCTKATGTVLVTSLLKDEPLGLPKKWKTKTFCYKKPQSMIDWQIRNGIIQEKKGGWGGGLRNEIFPSCWLALVFLGNCPLKKKSFKATFYLSPNIPPSPPCPPNPAS